MTTESGYDPTAHAHLLHQVFDAALAGDRTPVAPRTLISESWRRSLAAHVDRRRVTGVGVDPGHGAVALVGHPHRSGAHRGGTWTATDRELLGYLAAVRID